MFLSIYHLCGWLFNTLMLRQVFCNIFILLLGSPKTKKKIFKKYSKVFISLVLYNSVSTFKRIQLF